MFYRKLQNHKCTLLFKLLPYLAVAQFCISGCLGVYDHSYRRWYIQEKKFSSPLDVTFCIGTKRECPGTGKSFQVFTVFELNEKGQPFTEVWEFEHISGQGVFKEFTYGVVPEGYKETIPPKELKLNTYYQVEYNNFFRLGIEEGKYTIKVFNRNDDEYKDIFSK